MGWFSRKPVAKPRDEVLRIIIETTIRHRQGMGKQYSPDIVERAMVAAMPAFDRDTLIDAIQRCLEDDEAEHNNLMPGAYAMQDAG